MIFIVFADIEAAREKEAYLSVAEISKIPGVKGVYLTFGGHDFVVIHEAPDLASSVQTAVKIRNIPGVTDTETVICMDIHEVFEKK